MVSVFVTVAFDLNVLAWFLVESLLAASRAEVIGLALILGLASGNFWVNIHTTNGVFYHVFSPLLVTSFSYITSLRPRGTGRQRHLSYFSVGNSACFAENLTQERIKKHPMAHRE